MNLLLGFGTIIFCLAVQCVVVSVTIRLLHTLEEKHLIGNTLFSNWLLLISVVMVFLTTNLLQAAIWSGLFFALGEFEDFRTAFYYSLVNFTTLGYGDLVMSPERRILGALEAANGVLMLGLTTSVLYSTVGALMRLRRKSQEKRKSP